MSISRVNIERDKPSLVTAAKDLKSEDPKFTELTLKVFALESDFRAALGKRAKPLLKQSRALYTQSDKLLKTLSKDKDSNKEKIKKVQEIRKIAYNLGMLAKELDY